MAYASLQNMVDRFGEEELASLAPHSNESFDADKVSLALSDAEAVIDGYIAKRYSLPVPVIPPVVTGISCDIARYFLYTDDPQEIVKERYQSAIKVLKDIANGTISLPIDEGGSEPEQADEVIFVGGPERVFSQNSMKGF